MKPNLFLRCLKRKIYPHLIPRVWNWNLLLDNRQSIFKYIMYLPSVEVNDLIFLCLFIGNRWKMTVKPKLINIISIRGFFPLEWQLTTFFQIQETLKFNCAPSYIWGLKSTSRKNGLQILSNGFWKNLRNVWGSFHGWPMLNSLPCAWLIFLCKHISIFIEARVTQKQCMRYP